MAAMPSSSRTLFRAALVIFVVTVVIGILNGIDVWDPPRNTLLTHVHAGTLGWITLGVFGGAIWMIGDRGSSTAIMAKFSVFAIAAYVLAFWSVDLTDTTSIQRPIGGTLAFIAMAWLFIWAVGAMRSRPYDVAQFGMVLSLAFLVFGAVLGVLLGLQLADVEVVAPENAGRLAESHPGAMVAGFVVLAGLALIEWLIQDEAPRLGGGWRGILGTIQMLLLFLAGVILVVGFLVDNQDLLQLGVPLQVL
jgi:cbb3-type cytochrome oxidase subunit 1